ncbi:MAG: serine/threonine protein kinase [Archangiaceae bacterium]|nr:serine/threonine protein kinase [Archangiaceae bacterium]
MAADPTAISRPKPADFIPGYRLEKLVGKGGMGEVHQAVQLSLGRTVAVKLLSAELAQDESFVARFEKEGAALAALRHPNIVSIVDKGRNKETYYLVMEFVDGPSMREVMRSPLLDFGQALRMMMQICRAIEYAHGRGVIHRDLKPENILFDEQAGGIAKVTDFGLAGFDEKAGLKHNLTQTNVAMGTASYMAPEQQVDAKNADHRADVYSLGVLLYELLCGDVPMGNFDAPSVRKPQLDKRLDAIVARCLKTSPSERYQKVGEMIADLEPLVPAVSMVGTAQLSGIGRAMRRAREIARTIGRVAAAILVVSALAVLTASFMRTGAKEKKMPAGFELTTDFGSKFPVPQAGRIDKESHVITLGDGPDQISVVAMGRKAVTRAGDIVYGPPEDAPVGRTVVDVTADGEGLSLSAKVETQAVRRSSLEPLYEIFRGPRADARSALMLVGDTGRYVALIISGTGDDPRLEWALGPDHRGVMTTAMSLAPGSQNLELKIDPVTGALSAMVGKDRDQRLLGSVIALGPKWKELFGDAPHPALGCLEGTCAFHQVVLKGLKAPAPAPVVAQKDDEPEPAKRPVQVSQNTVRKPAPAPPPPQRPPVQAKNEKKGQPVKRR